jgi:hypothetical protein
MSDTNRPVGERFTHLYMRGEPMQDSKRMRRRLTELVRTLPLDNWQYVTFLRAELGLDQPWTTSMRDLVEWIFDLASSDFLDFITVTYRYLNNGQATSAARWRSEVDRIFREENVHYGLDERAGVHFRYDQQFEENRGRAIAALTGSRYRSTLNEFEKGMDALAKAPPDGKMAVMHTFRAVEGLFRLMFARAPRLGGAEAGQHLEPVLQRIYSGDNVAKNAASKMLNAFKDWIDAAHFYRHEVGQEEPSEPPLGLVILITGQGASFLRWLAELDTTQIAVETADGK